MLGFSSETHRLKAVGFAQRGELLTVCTNLNQRFGPVP
jgi:hypothetical protein